MIERPKFKVDLREIPNRQTPVWINIIEGWFYWLFKKESELTKKRRAICKGCEFNKRNKWLFWIRLCTACGCVIKAKTACEDCGCIRGKW
jgi:hypothetical protein